MVEFWDGDFYYHIMGTFVVSVFAFSVYLFSFSFFLPLATVLSGVLLIDTGTHTELTSCSDITTVFLRDLRSNKKPSITFVHEEGGTGLNQ